MDALGSGMGAMGPQGPAMLAEVPAPGTALADELDKRLLVTLRDGRNIIGVLRSFDQFANLVLEGAVERIIVGTQYGDIPLGLNVVRGENVVLLGELDESRSEVPPHFARVSAAEIKLAKQAEKTEQAIKGTMRARMDFLDLD